MSVRPKMKIFAVIRTRPLGSHRFHWKANQNGLPTLGL
jgi:hypothetical protein